MKVKIGQVWKDCDPRFQGNDARYLKIISIPNDLCVQVKNTKTGRKSVITKYRLRPGCRGYILIKEKL